MPRPTHPYIAMARGQVFLTAVLDWYSRRVLAHRVSITMDTEFCIEALQEAIARHGAPQIMNTDQGSQFTSDDFIKELQDIGIAISTASSASSRSIVDPVDQPTILREHRSMTTAR